MLMESITSLQSVSKRSCFSFVGRNLQPTIYNSPFLQSCWYFASRLCVYDCIQANIFLFKVSSRNTRKSREVCSKLTTKTPEIPELRQERRSGVFIVNFEHFLYLLLLMTLNKQMFVGLILRRLNNCFSSRCTRNLINMLFRFLLEPTPFSFDEVRWSNLFDNFFPS